MSVVETFRDSLEEFTRSAVEFVHPSRCVRCGTSIDITTLPGTTPGRRRFCSECHELLRCRNTRSCLTCGAPVGPHLETRGCRHCRDDRFAFSRVFALGVYEGALKECCQRIKEPFQQPLAAGLAELLWDAHGDSLQAVGIDVVMSVPHHWWDRVARRHQPAATVGQVLARRLSIPMKTRILAKRRRTPAQSSLSPAQRRRNLRDAFRVCRGGIPRGKNVLLTDDILTTGTTADRVAGVLKKAGADQVFVAVLGRGLGQTSPF